MAGQLTWTIWAWRWIKRISLILGVILACLKLFDWGATFFRSDLVARLEGGAFGLPPQLDDFYADLTKKLDADTFVPRVLADENFKSRADNVKELSESRREDVVHWVGEPFAKIARNSGAVQVRSIQSYWTGTVTNSSSGQVTAVQLYLNGAKFALLTRDDNSKTSQSTENLVNIGDSASAKNSRIDMVRIWLDYYSTFAPPIRLTHRSGVGKVTIPRL